MYNCIKLKKLYYSAIESNKKSAIYSSALRNHLMFNCLDVIRYRINDYLCDNAIWKMITNN